MWTLLFALVSFAQDSESERYCFKSSSQREKIHREVKAILLPVDQLTVSENCLVINMKPHRRELIQNYIRSLDPQVAITFSSAEIKRDPCLIKVEKARTKHAQSRIGSATIEGVAISQSQTESKDQDTMQIQTLKDFELQSNQDVIKGECRFISADRLEITLNVRKDPKPQLPAVPAGTIINLPTQPPAQETASLTTTLQLTRGTKIEIGKVVRELRAKNHEQSIPAKGDYDDRSNSTHEEIYLSVD